MRARNGSAARIRDSSAASKASTGLPLRGSGRISVNTSGNSRGMRWANSSKPASTQAGMRVPTAHTSSFIVQWAS